MQGGPYVSVGVQLYQQNYDKLVPESPFLLHIYIYIYIYIHTIPACDARLVASH